MVENMLNVETDPRVEQWFEMIEGSKATRKSYLTLVSTDMLG